MRWQAAGYEGKVKIGMDVAASEFFKDDKYDLDFKNKNSDGSKVLTGCACAHPLLHTMCTALYCTTSSCFHVEGVVHLAPPRSEIAICGPKRRCMD